MRAREEEMRSAKSGAETEERERSKGGDGTESVDSTLLKKLQRICTIIEGNQARQTGGNRRRRCEETA